MVSAESAFVTDKAGTILAYYIKQGASATGRSLKNRPYIQSALQGESNMYAAIGGNTHDRGIYIASPVKTHDALDAEIIGVITLKISFELVDALLEKQNGHFALMSPENAIFSSNLPGTQLQIYAEEGNLEKLAHAPRLGKFFSIRRPEKLTGPLTLTSALRLPVQWNDPYGPWTLLAHPNKHLGLSITEGLVCTLIYLIVAAALLSNAHMRRSRREEQAHNQARLTAYVKQLEHAAHRKSALAQMSLKLQQSGEISYLGQAFLSLARKSLPIHQGALYVLDPNWPEQLLFAAGYGSTPDAGAPHVVHLGETLIGECAQTRETLQIADPPAGFWRIQTSDSNLNPRHLQLIPLVRDEHLLGVLELASLQTFTDEEQSFLDEMCVLLTMNLGILSHTAARESALAAESI